jgi:hypothetical protein
MLRVSNSGSATLVITGITVESGGPFTPLTTSLVIAPGGMDSVAVVFEPPALQNYDDALLLVHNAPGSPLRERLSGSGSPPVDGSPVEHPWTFQLRESTPNPFGTSGTVISYALPEACDVQLVVYNALGQEVSRLVEQRQGAGHYAVRFPTARALAGGMASTLPSGVYFFKLRAGAFEATKQMVYVR